LEQLIEIGSERILTSGQQPSVADGIELVAELQQKADDRIIIMPGSGVRKENIKMLAEKTGCVEFHSSLRGKESSKMEYIHPSFRDSGESYANNAISPDEVRALRNTLL
jgi:copper homeostasis protein